MTHLLTRLVIFCLAFGLAATQPVYSAKPNILFVLMDDLGWSDLGCYGGKTIRTPNLDQFAAQGLRFTDAYSAAPVCTPSRACIISGQMSPRHGIYSVSPDPVGREAEAKKYEATLRTQKLAVVENNHLLPASLTALPAALKSVGYVTGFAGKWHHRPSPTALGFEVHKRVKRDKSDPKQMFGVTQLAIDFMREQTGSDRPWFFYLSHDAPHVRAESRPETLAKYRASIPADSPIKPEYAAMVADADDAFGRLMQALDELQLAANTVVVFFSDNGGYLKLTSNAPLREGKGSFYEGGLREPLLVRWPGVVKPGISAVPVIAVDFMPTFLELAGAAQPKGQASDGISLVSLLRNGQAPEREALYWHFPHYNTSYGQTPCSVIRRGSHKLIHFYEDDRSELYDLTSDIGEAHDLAATRADLCSELKTKLDQWLTSMSAPLPKPLPGSPRHPKPQAVTANAPKTTSEVRKLADGFRFTEGPAWSPSEQALYFSDIPNKTIHLWSVNDGTKLVRSGGQASNGIIVDREGRLIFCEVGGRRIVRRSTDGKEETLADSCDGKPLAQPNDLWLAPDGAVYFTLPRMKTERSKAVPPNALHGTVCRISPDGKTLTDVGAAIAIKTPNGVVGTADGKRIYITNGATCVRADIQPDGTLANPKVAAEKGSDGLALDEHGNLYTTAKEGVAVWSPEAKQIALIPVPESPANMKFGGEDGRTLFITARTSLYAVEMSIAGDDLNELDSRSGTRDQQK
jgi:arylsulfatase A-like enzyme/sugar lactone lactonase YvrE